MSTNITAVVHIYATDGLNKGKNPEIASTSIFNDTIIAPPVKLSSIEYSDSSRLDKLKIKCATALECRDKHNVEVCSIDAPNGFRMWNELIANNYVIAGVRNIGAYNNIAVGSDIIANY